MPSAGRGMIGGMSSSPEPLTIPGSDPRAVDILSASREGDLGRLQSLVTDHPGLARVRALLADEQAMRAINLRRVARAVVGAEPGSEGSVTKLLISQHGQRAAELAMGALGAAAGDGSVHKVVAGYLYSWSLTIVGGIITQIAKNLIAERILGLPHDPLVR